MDISGMVLMERVKVLHGEIYLKPHFKYCICSTSASKFQKAQGILVHMVCGEKLPMNEEDAE